MMTQVRKMFVLICSIGLVLFSSCKKDNEPITKGEPTLEEIHAKGAKTLNELLLEYEKEIQGEGVVTEEPQSHSPLRGYGPVQRKTYYGFTKDAYLTGRTRLCYLNVDSYQGYFLVDIHSVTLEIKAKPFTEYEQEDSPKCGYIPTSYTDPSLTLPNGFNNPI